MLISFVHILEDRRCRSLSYTFRETEMPISCYDDSGVDQASLESKIKLKMSQILKKDLNSDMQISQFLKNANLKEELSIYRVVQTNCCPCYSKNRAF